MIGCLQTDHFSQLCECNDIEEPKGSEMSARSVKKRRMGGNDRLLQTNHFQPRPM